MFEVTAQAIDHFILRSILHLAQEFIQGEVDDIMVMKFQRSDAGAEGKPEGPTAMGDSELKTTHQYNGIAHILRAAAHALSCSRSSTYPTTFCKSQSFAHSLG
ncbi:MAG TPA: hypothetical protein VNM47_15560 [Terriglobia bacterium]|nr:hypothetical protein [Terriglobia bacterium]